ncbi:MAG: 50S ribosomal protein L3 [Deltaproteobacteria bacterium]|nr:50S ribosomal protein L3 [Deltaproteobacteria bacterium]
MNKHPGIIGTKLGMTQLFLEDGNVVSCTVIQAGCRVVGKRTQDRDGYDALILGIGERKDKHTSKAVRTAFGKVGQKPPRLVREMRGTPEYVAGFEIGQDVKVEEIFQEGQKVDVQATSKGRGFSGVVRRYHFAGATSSHGAHESTRHGGSIGTTTTPGRVLKGRKMPGQHGNKTVTVLSQKVVKLIPEKQLVLIAGGVPGAPSSVVRVQGAVKKGGGKPTE